jgi:thioredoxin-dependent peroxiredoxin
MAKITLKGNEISTNAELPTGIAPNFSLVKSDLTDVQLSDYKGKKVLLNIFPSLDTSVCAASVRKFNAELNSLPNTVVLCISKDLPFAHKRFCEVEGLSNVISLSEFRDTKFSTTYGVSIIDGPLKGLMARSVIAINENGSIVYSELVSEIAQEPNYKAAVAAVK